MRGAILGLSLLLASCDKQDESQQLIQTMPCQERIDYRLLQLDLDHWHNNEMDVRNKIVILKRSGYKVKAGFSMSAGPIISLRKNNNWMYVSKEDILNFPLYEADLANFISSYKER